MSGFTVRRRQKPPCQERNQRFTLHHGHHMGAGNNARLSDGRWAIHIRLIMGVQISYMGTKKELANAVARVVDCLPDGALLDAFAGMGAVGEALVNERPIWVNDCQTFASTVSKALFTSRHGPPATERAEEILEGPFQRNARALERRFEKYLQKEELYLETLKFKDAVAGNNSLHYVGSDPSLELERQKLERRPQTFPYRMMTITYVGSYFGVRQCIEIDSIRYAIDAAGVAGLVGLEQRQWLLIALCQVAARVNNSTGQFAQYIKPNTYNLHRIVQKRRRSVWREFLGTIDGICPLGGLNWRCQNKAYKSDALALMASLHSHQQRPALVYADPPYSKAEYSRYYHVLDMILEYRYPPVSSVGRYPDGRPYPVFGRIKTVASAMEKLIERSAKLGASLVLTYPSCGILHKHDLGVLDLMRQHYLRVEIAYSECRKHSTFGGPNTTPSVRAVENVYVGTLS